MTLELVLDPVDKHIASAELCGQRITPWVRATLKAWAARNVRLPNTGKNKGKNPDGLTCIDVGVWPIVCDCSLCKEPSLIFPPEDGSPDTGYCICPCCSRPGGCEHRAKPRVA